MLSDEKISHIVHLLLEGLALEQMVELPKKDLAMREGKQICTKFISSLSACEEIAKQRIRSQKNPPPENSSQWDILYSKYFEEEMKKKRGAG